MPKREPMPASTPEAPSMIDKLADFLQEPEAELLIAWDVGEIAGDNYADHDDDEYDQLVTEETDRVMSGSPEELYNYLSENWSKDDADDYINNFVPGQAR
jgi:hypothetical protein